MARVNILALVNSISKESVTHPEVKDVHVTAGDVAASVKEDTDQRTGDEGVDAEVSNTKTTQPGPKDGGGNGTAHTVDVKNVKTHTSTKDLHFDGDQNGGRLVDELPNKVKPKDGLSASDISHSVESHDETSSETSELETIDTGGAEQVGEADDLVMDIDSESEAVEILSNTEIDHAVAGKILSEIGELENAKAAVESYLGVLTSMEKRGVEMSNELRAVMAAGLKSISIEMFEPEICSLENFRVSNEDGGVAPYGRQSGGKGEFVGDDDDTEFDGARDKASKGLSGKLKQFWEAIKRAWHRSMSALEDIWRSFTQDTSKVEAHLKDLKGRVRNLQGGETMQLKNATRLMIGGEFAGDSPEAIKTVNAVANEFLLMWPSRLAKILDEAKKGHHNIGGMLEALEQAIEGSFRGMKQLSPNDKDKVPSGFLDVQEMRWSEPLVGNRALYVGFQRSNKRDVSASYEDAGNIGKAVNIDFSAVPGMDTHTGETEIQSISGGDAQRVIAELQKLISTVTGRREGIDKLRKMSNEVVQGATYDAIFRGINDGNATAIILGGAVAKVTASGEHAFIGYMLSMIKAYIGFIEGSIKVEEGKGAGGNTYDA